ncbi:MAG: hypothetical protein GC191_11275 [Azospirillum sp.]|nr:hypothetical protein [Azospirillum sp.]
MLMTGPAAAQTAWDHAKVVGPTECAECHKAENEVWKGTHHFSTFTQLPRKKSANEIAERMGLRRIKADSLCLDCHFTTVEQGGEREPIAGVSCESCHAPGRDWKKVHSTYSGKKKGQESAQEIAQRWAAAEKAGMIRPKNMYRWAKNCYSCHVVPQEKLVNVGKHEAGSDFELVAWSQGEIRHNLWYNDGKVNEPASQNTKRLMYVVGQAVELETALRAVGKATEKAAYAVTMAKRAQADRASVAKLAGLLRIPELQEISAAGNGAGLKLNNNGELSAAADKIAAATQRLVAKYDGSSFGAIDSVLPPESSYKGRPAR